MASNNFVGRNGLVVLSGLIGHIGQVGLIGVIGVIGFGLNASSASAVSSARRLIGLTDSLTVC